MASLQGGVFRIRGARLTEQAGSQSINIVVVSNDELHGLGAVWFFPIDVVSDPSAEMPEWYVRITDLKKANVAENSFVDCKNLNAQPRAVLSEDKLVGEKEIGRLVGRDWKRVHKAFERFGKDRQGWL